MAAEFFCNIFAVLVVLYTKALLKKKGVDCLSENELCEYIHSYRGIVFRLAFSYLKNREDAEDISQEAFVKLYQSDESFDTAENVKAWLIRVTINLSKNLLKNFWRRGRVELEKDIPYDNKSEEALLEFVAKLKPKYSVVIHLFYYEGYSVNEIAKLCNISSTAVRTRLNRARNQLKAMLLEEGLDETGIQQAF